MLIPSKHSGYQAGIRLYPMGGGGGGGGSTDVSAPATLAPAPPAPPPPPYANMAVNTQQGYDTLAGMKGTPWFQSGNAYNELLNQGFNTNQIKDSASAMYGAPSDANWSALVQDAGMKSPTGRPMAGSEQFYQPVYNSSYQNYANPLGAFNVSSYGTNPGPSNAQQYANLPGGIGQGQFMRNTQNYAANAMNQPGGADMNRTLQEMRTYGMNPQDLQSAYNFGAPQQSFQMQAPFNPYSGSSQTPFSFGGQQSYQPQGGFGSSLGSLFGQSMYGGPSAQMQSPFSYQQPQQQYSPYQQYQPQQYSPYQQYQPQQSYDEGFVAPQQPQPVPQRTSSGPSQAIVGRSAGFRGTPNVMRRAKGGIAALMDDVE